MFRLHDSYTFNLLNGFRFKCNKMVEIQSIALAFMGLKSPFYTFVATAFDFYFVEWIYLPIPSFSYDISTRFCHYSDRIDN